MSGDCLECGEHCLDCFCRNGYHWKIPNYFLLDKNMLDEVKVWAQMFFDDGSVTKGKYLSRYIYDDNEFIKKEAEKFLRETGRKEGVLFIWGAGRVYAKKVDLLLARRGTFKGRETLRLRNL